MARKKTVFVLGPPGAGKGTQCKKIAEKYGFDHVSAGDLLRKELQNPNSEHKGLIDNYMKNGKVLPAEITCKLLDAYIESSTKDYFLVDGFPRTRENREGWYEIIGDKVDVLFVLFIDCLTEVCIDRCLLRGASESQRSDDTMDIVQKRIDTFTNETRPTLEYWEKLNLLKTVDGNQTDDKIFDDIQKIFNGFNPNNL